MKAKHYILAETGERLTPEQAEKIMERNRLLLALPADEFIRRVHEIRFLVATEI